jgi:hypothetical protein
MRTDEYDVKGAEEDLDLALHEYLVTYVRTTRILEHDKVLARVLELSDADFLKMKALLEIIRKTTFFIGKHDPGNLPDFPDLEEILMGMYEDGQSQQ